LHRFVASLPQKRPTISHRFRKRDPGERSFFVFRGHTAVCRVDDMSFYLLNHGDWRRGNTRHRVPIRYTVTRDAKTQPWRRGNTRHRVPDFAGECTRAAVHPRAARASSVIRVGQGDVNKNGVGSAAGFHLAHRVSCHVVMSGIVRRAFSVTAPCHVCRNLPTANRPGSRDDCV